MEICVFCSSSDNIDDVYFNSAAELGKIIGKKGHNLVYGAGKIGLMGKISVAVKQNGGAITGVIPETLNKKGITSEIDNVLIVTVDMHERKKIMFEKSNAFIALPGGFGTIEELLEVLTLKQLRYHKKPVVILNICGFYNDILKQFGVFFQQKFAKKEYASLYYVAENPKDAVRYIEDYKYKAVNDKWFD